MASEMCWSIRSWPFLTGAEVSASQLTTAPCSSLDVEDEIDVRIRPDVLSDRACHGDLLAQIVGDAGRTAHPRSGRTRSSHTRRPPRPCRPQFHRADR